MKTIRRYILPPLFAVTFLYALLHLVASQLPDPSSPGEVGDPPSCTCAGKHDCHVYKFLTDDEHFAYCMIAEEGVCCVDDPE